MIQFGLLGYDEAHLSGSRRLQWRRCVFVALRENCRVQEPNKCNGTNIARTIFNKLNEHEEGEARHQVSNLLS